MKITAQ